jgi:hypothetical protein
MQYLERLADQLRRLGPGRPELNLERRLERLVRTALAG